MESRQRWGKLDEALCGIRRAPIAPNRACYYIRAELKGHCVAYWSQRAYGATLVAATSKHISAADSPEQGSGQRWGLPRGQAVARGGDEFGWAYQWRTGGDSASAAIQGVGVAPALSDGRNQWSAGRGS